MAGKDVSYLDKIIADSKLTDKERKAYLWLGKQLFGWKYLPAVGAWTDNEGRTASEGAALRWLQTPSAVAEVIEVMNSKEFYLLYEQFPRVSVETEGLGHRAGFMRHHSTPRMWSYNSTFVAAVLIAAYLTLKAEHGEAPEL